MFRSTMTYKSLRQLKAIGNKDFGYKALFKIFKILKYSLYGLPEIIETNNIVHLKLPLINSIDLKWLFSIYKNIVGLLMVF